ncbi:MAG: GIY-YIG nuclease family protein [Deltaproteobacteria bacterium]|nr:MAG: GIY-YIG nuclease family protein [Deltaproteobacteria bacterium]
MGWFVYLIEATNGHLYCGVTTDLKRRFSEHKAGKGAKFFRAQKPVKIVYSEKFPDRSKAQKREWEIKKMKRIGKLELIKKKGP